MSSTLRYILHAEDKDYSSLIDSNSIFLHNLLPNHINIFPMYQLDDLLKQYILINYQQLIYLIFPVYKHLWNYKTLYIKNNLDNTFNVICEIKNSNLLPGYVFFNFKNDVEQFKIDLLDETKLTVNNNSITFLNYSFTFEAFSFLFLHVFETISSINLFPVFLYGIIEACIDIGFGSIPFKQKKKKENKYKFNFEKNNLKSLYISNQIQIFNIWKNKEDLLLTGGTGIGKTSQIPKLFWWINFLYDGYDEILNFQKFFFSINYFQTNKNYFSKNTVISLPRKILINDNSRQVMNSLGFKNISDSPINCKYKDVKETEYYNHNINNFLNPFIFCINRNTQISNVNTIIFDEIHEHETYCDIYISIVKKHKLKYKIRNIVLITATIEDDLPILQNFFPNLKYIHIKGKTLFNIQDHNYSTICNLKNSFQKLEQIIQKHSTEIGKSTLIFFPTLPSIDKQKIELEQKLNSHFYKIFTLHRNSLMKNPNILKEITSNKTMHSIVLTTPIAESSITISNARVVIDTGLFYSKQFYSGSVLYITRSMMSQRKGRVGRVSEGVYIKLYDDQNLNLTFKKIDYEFLLPYIINCSYFNLEFTELFILPSNMSRFNNTLTYFKKKGLNIKKNISEIYKIYNNNNCTIPEYLLIYINGKEKEITYLKQLDDLTNTFTKIDLVNKNYRIFYSIAKHMNIITKTKQIQEKKILDQNNMFFYNIKESRVSFIDYYEKINDYKILLLHYKASKPYFLTEQMLLY